MVYIVSDRNAHRSGLSLGGKATALAFLLQYGLPIPEWFAVLPFNFSDASSSAFIEELTQALDRLSPNGELLAVRSSAMEEDGIKHSFAGMFDSYLFISPQDVFAKIQDIWASTSSERIQAYQAEHQLLQTIQPPVIIVQRMIHARCAGVAFSADPLTGQRDVTVISAVHGLGSSLVSGACDADMFYAAPNENERILHQQIAAKMIIHRLNPTGGIEVAENPPDWINKPALDKQEARVISHLVRLVETLCNKPQDIEWAIEEDQLYLLQARPITTGLEKNDDINPEYLLWDNTTLVESWHGVVTPLTFSLSEKMISAVYLSLSIYTCTPKISLRHLEAYFASLSLVGEIQGRLYLNQTRLEESWVVAPSLEYMISKLRLNEPLTANDQASLIKKSFGLLIYLLTLPLRNRYFLRKINRVLKANIPNVDTDLAKLLHQQESLLDVIQNYWDVPTLNNFFATQCYRLLQWMAERWLNDKTLPNEWLFDDRQSLSQNVTQRLREMAAIASKQPALQEQLKRGEMEGLKIYPEFHQRLLEYLSQYGERCQDDLHMDSISLAEQPLPLLRMILNLSAQPASANVKSNSINWRVMPISFLQKTSLLWMVWLTRRQIRDKELLRFQLTRLVDRLRSVLNRTGVLLHADHSLQHPLDIQFLYFNEIALLINQGALVCREMQALILTRRHEYQENLKKAPLPSILATYNKLKFIEHEVIDLTSTLRQGVGCSTGELIAKVYRVLPGQFFADQQGNLNEDNTDYILLAPYCDPGLVTLFPLVKGLLCEHGNPLSHAAIVARELALPAVVAIPGLTDWLKDGDWVKMNGKTGLVQKVEASHQRSAANTSTKAEVRG